MLYRLIQIPIYYVDGDLDESIKHSASDRLGDLVPQVRARTSPGVFRDMALLGLCLELSFNINHAGVSVCLWVRVCMNVFTDLETELVSSNSLILVYLEHVLCLPSEVCR